MSRSGFSLVELSIVLVIVGLLVGGIMAGQSLIRAAQLNKLMRAQETYQIAFRGFRDKYQAIPGDFTEATRLWGRRQNIAWCVTNSSAAVNTRGTCDGNGNESATAGATMHTEGTLAWEQLSLSGMVQEGFRYAGGYNESTAMGVLYPGPLGPENAAIWLTCEGAGPDCAGTVIWQNTGHFLRIGTPASGTTGLGWGGLKVDDALNIDIKIDDGKPSYGRFLSQRVWTGTGSPCSGLPAGELCVDGNPSSHSPVGKIYQTSSPNAQCSVCISHIKIW